MRVHVGDSVQTLRWRADDFGSALPAITGVLLLVEVVVTRYLLR